MKESLNQLLTSRLSAAISKIGGPIAGSSDAQVRLSKDARFGDYQCNAAMALAKSLGAKPRELAERIVAAADMADIADRLEIAGAGFINIFLKSEFLARLLGEIPAPPAESAERDRGTKGPRDQGIEGSRDQGGVNPSAATGVIQSAIRNPQSTLNPQSEISNPQSPPESKIQNPRSKIAQDRVGIPPVEAGERRRVVVDYSSPNIAKQMHVGHIRSTIIGDVFARVLAFLGHDVVRQNHVGDWGTAIGMVILGLWYTETRTARGEDETAIAARVKALLAAREKSPDERRAIVEPICREWSHDVKKSLPPPRAPTLDELELGYQFVQALMAAATGLGCAVEDDKGVASDITGVPRKVTQMLQEGGEHVWEREMWRRARDISINYCQGLYDEPRADADGSRRIGLGVLLTPADVCGESFYSLERDRLAGVIDELTRVFCASSRASSARDQGIEGLRDRSFQSDSEDQKSPLRESLLTSDGAGDPSHEREQSKIQDPKSKIGTGCAELREDSGALCIFMYDGAGNPRYKTAEGEPLPLILRKSDGAYLYATTDLAALRYRTTELRFPETGRVGADRLIYVTGAPQKLHFQMFFDAARMAGWVPPGVSLEHVTFGIILGEDRKPFKTREGGVVRLKDVLDEAVRRARALVDENDAKRRSEPAAAAETDGAAAAGAEGGPGRATEAEGEAAIRRAGTGRGLSDAEKQEIAERVGIAAVKYADLSKDRNTDYLFSYDKMLAMQGNTAPYMMYAYARIRSIYRKAAEQFGAPDVYADGVRLVLREPAERALGLRIAALRDTIDALAADLLPHVLCAYLYDLASEFMRFYETCPVISAADEAVRLGRMRLCDLTARALRLGLSLLGIAVIERM